MTKIVLHKTNLAQWIRGQPYDFISFTTREKNNKKMWSKKNILCGARFNWTRREHYPVISYLLNKQICPQSNHSSAIAARAYWRGCCRVEKSTFTQSSFWGGRGCLNSELNSPTGRYNVPIGCIPGIPVLQGVSWWSQLKVSPTVRTGGALTTVDGGIAAHTDAHTPIVGDNEAIRMARSDSDCGGWAGGGLVILWMLVVVTPVVWRHPRQFFNLSSSFGQDSRGRNNRKLNALTIEKRYLQKILLAISMSNSIRKFDSQMRFSKWTVTFQRWCSEKSICVLSGFAKRRKEKSAKAPFQWISLSQFLQLWMGRQPNVSVVVHDLLLSLPFLL